MKEGRPHTCDISPVKNTSPSTPLSMSPPDPAHIAMVLIISPLLPRPAAYATWTAKVIRNSELGDVIIKYHEGDQGRI
jgi:hypothetical protein